MQRARLFTLILASLVSSLAFAEVTIKDVKNNSAANSVLYSVKDCKVGSN